MLKQRRSYDRCDDCGRFRAIEYLHRTTWVDPVRPHVELEPNVLCGPCVVRAKRFADNRQLGWTLVDRSY